MPVTEQRPAFTAGELSPRLLERSDLEKYRTGCRTLRNFIVTHYGGAARRSGLTYIGAAKTAGSAVALIPFNVARSVSYVIEAGENYLRFYRDGQQLQSGGSAYEVASPWTAAQVAELQYVQVNDVLFVVHPDVSPRRLSRAGDTDWTLEETPFDPPPFLDRNTTDTTITLGATTGSGISLTASADLFDADHVGSYWRIGHVRDTATSSIDLTATGQSANISIVGTYNVRTSGVWSATFQVERSTDGGSNWSTVLVVSGNKNINKDVELVQSREAALFRINITSYTSHSTTGGVNPQAWIEPQDGEVFGYAKITAVADAQNATATVIDDFDKTDATDIWQEGAWSDYQGWPRAVTLHEGRIWYAGTTRRPQTVWASAVDDYLSFAAGVGDSDSLTYTLASRELNSVVWMLSEDALLIGTLGGEWVMTGAGGKDEAITPSSVKARNPTKIGSSDDVPAIIVDDVALFVEPAGTRMRETVFSFEADKYVTTDLTLLSEHILSTGAVSVAYQKQRDPVLWCVLADGGLASLTYNRAQNVVGWARHDTDGEFESVAVIYGGSEDAEDDQVWFVVRREIGGATVRYIERFPPGRFRAVEDDDPSNWVYLDSAVAKANGGATTVSGLDHLEGETVGVLNDGSKEPDKVVASGQITLERAGGDVVVGLPFTSELEPTPFEGATGDGVSVNRRKRVKEAAVAFYKSLGGRVGDGASGGESDILVRTSTDQMGEGLALQTGFARIRLDGKHERKATVKVTTDEPFPMFITSIVPKFHVHGQ